MESAAAISTVAKSVTVLCATEEPMPVYGRDVGCAVRKVIVFDFFVSKL